MPGLPHAALRHFVKDVGLRISHKQLIAAAYQQVAKIENWVKAQEDLGIKMDLSNVVVAVCRGGIHREMVRLIAYAGMSGDARSLLCHFEHQRSRIPLSFFSELCMVPSHHCLLAETNLEQQHSPYRAQLCVATEPIVHDAAEEGIMPSVSARYTVADEVRLCSLAVVARRII